MKNTTDIRRWDDLSIAEKSKMMEIAIKNGITDLPTIKAKYNEFADGGDMEQDSLPPIVPFKQSLEVVITPDSEYNRYLNTLPDNQRFTPNDKYDSYLYWKLHGKPKNFKEAYQKRMFHYDNSDKSYHANSIAWGDDGIGYFMKPKNHGTVGYELDWFNKGLVTEEGGYQRPETSEEKAESDVFRKNYELVTDPNRPNYYRYQLKKMKSLGGSFAEGGDTENEDTAPVSVNIAAPGGMMEEKNTFPNGGLMGGSPIMPFATAPKVVDAIRRRAYKTINPLTDYDIAKNAKEFLKGNKMDYGDISTDSEGNKYVEFMDGAVRPEIVDDIWATYLQIPEAERRYDVRLQKSDYRPAMGDRKENTYYRLPLRDLDIERIIEETNDLKIGTNKVYGGSPLSYYNLADHTLGRGVDEEGREYRSYYDRWDLNPFQDKYQGTKVPLLESLGDTSLGIGNPVEIYDRIYLDDYYGLPRSKGYTTYLPEVEVTPKDAVTMWDKEIGDISKEDFEKLVGEPTSLKANKRALGGPLVQAAMSHIYDGTTEDSQQMNVLSTGNANLYGFGDWLKKGITRAREVVHSLGLDKSPSQHILERIFSDDGKNNTEEKELSNTSIAASSKSGKRVAPVRQRSNASKTTPKESILLENMMRDYLINKDKTVGTSNPEYDIPFIPEKAIIINNSTTSTNVLDSLAKYAGIHNRNVQLSQHPIHEREYYTKRNLSRPVTMNEMLGLSTRETTNGAMPAYNYAKNNEDKRKVLNIDYKRYNNALGNANYFTAFGSIPAEYLVRNFHYNDTGVDRTTPPLLDAFRYYAQGDYNPGEPGHTANVQAIGEKAWHNPYVRKWWEESGQYWYNGTK